MKLKPLILGLCIALLLPFMGYSQVKPIKFEQYKLKNGLHVILHQDNTTPVVAVSMLYHVGSKNEQPNRTGFAHFFEHLLFEGSENIQRGEFDKLVSGAGGRLNANTSFDRTFYYIELPSNQLELGLWMEAERLLHAKVEDIGIETQREVVKEERRQRTDNTPYGSILEETFGLAFTKHPYNWPVIGSMAHLNEAKKEEFIDFYKTFYVPNNAVLSIAGDFNTAETKAWIEKYFAGIPAGTKPIPRPDPNMEPARKAEARKEVYDNIQLPAVIFGYHSPAQGTPDYYAMSMLTTLLSDGQSSRFNKEIVDKQQKALFAGAFNIPTEHPGLILMFSISNMGVNPSDLEAAMDAEVAKVRENLISEAEFNKLMNQTETNFVSENRRMVAIAENLANYHTYYGDANLINTELDRYKKVTRQDIQRVAQKYLVKNNRVVLHYLPKQDN